MQSPRRGWDRYDTALVVAATIATAFVHPVHFALSHPYWLDESWVAVLTKAPWSRLVDLSSSSPAGFVALLKLVPGSGLQRGRLVVLAFSCLAVGAAYVVARTLAWSSRTGARFAGITAALVVMLAPAALMRNDLKQYTCDGFCALAVLAVGAWVDRAPSRARLAWFVGVAIVAAPFSSTSVFVSAALFAGLLAAAIGSRSLRRTVETVAAGAITGIAFGAYFAVAIAPNLNPKLKTYWADFYLDGSPRHMVHQALNRLSSLSHVLAMPVFVFIALFVLGIVVLARLRAIALAVAIPLLWIEMMAAARDRKYPFLDQRTSHFLFVSSYVVIAVGVAGVVVALAGVRVRRLALAGKGAALIVGGVAAAAFLAGSVQYVGDLHIPAENVRAPTLAVARDFHSGDVIVVSQPANFGFSYYWPHGHVEFLSTRSAQGFRAEVAGIRVIYTRGRRYGDIVAALRAGKHAWRSETRGSRLFIVRTHLSAGEAHAWGTAIHRLRLHPRHEAVGIDPLLVVGAR